MSLYRLLYRSEMHLAGTTASVDRQILKIVALSERRNAVEGLTGALVSTGGVFVQVLEGPLPAVEETFERICCDLRHRQVELIELFEAEERLFADWGMVQVAADRTLERRVSCLSAKGGQAAEPASAEATVQLMRALLLQESAQPRAFQEQTPRPAHSAA